MAFTKVLTKKDLSDGAKKTVFISGKRLMIANVGGTFFAIDDACTHAGCSLGTEGHMEGTMVICGCHGSKFEIATGKVMTPPATVAQGSYEVKVEGDDVMVML